MLPKTHVIAGAIFSVFFYFFFNVDLIGVSIIFLSSFLIDFDHYLYGVVKKKTLRYNKIYNLHFSYRTKWKKLSHSQKKKTKFPILIFHGVEFLILLFFLSFKFKISAFIFLGCFFHIFVDYIEIILNKDPLYVKLSPAYIYFTNKNKSTIRKN